jgi:hypothetical protein
MLYPIELRARRDKIHGKPPNFIGKRQFFIELLWPFLLVKKAQNTLLYPPLLPKREHRVNTVSTSNLNRVSGANCVQKGNSFFMDEVKRDTFAFSTGHAAMSALPAVRGVGLGIGARVDVLHVGTEGTVLRPFVCV